MARSLNKKYFGNRNVGTAATTDNGIGGEGVASVTIGGTWSGFTAETTTVVFSAPQLPTGVRATGTAVLTGDAVSGVTVTNKGSGYTSAPTVTIEDADAGVEATGTAVAVLTTDSGPVGSSTNQENAILVSANTTGAGAKLGDIVRQVGARRFKVRTADGVANCTLKDSAVASQGQMTITATDSAGGTYFVTKISAHRVTVTRGTGTQFDSGTSVQWSFAAPVAGQTLKVANA